MIDGGLDIFLDCTKDVAGVAWTNHRKAIEGHLHVACVYLGASSASISLTDHLRGLPLIEVSPTNADFQGEILKKNSHFAMDCMSFSTI